MFQKCDNGSLLQLIHITVLKIAPENSNSQKSINKKLGNNKYVDIHLAVLFSHQLWTPNRHAVVCTHLQVGLVMVKDISWFQKGSFSETDSGPISFCRLWFSARSLTWLVLAPISWQWCGNLLKSSSPSNPEENSCGTLRKHKVSFWKGMSIPGSISEH